MSRPHPHDTFLDLATTISLRSTCGRRQVGCVLVDEHRRVLSMGYSGVPRGIPHCLEATRCQGRGYSSGTGLDRCEAVHAEQNALMFCPDVMRIRTVYVTVSPCLHCVKMILNTGASQVIFREPYSHSEAEELWYAEVGSKEPGSWAWFPTPAERATWHLDSDASSLQEAQALAAIRDAHFDTTDLRQRGVARRTAAINSEDDVPY